ncbi:MAG: tRNA (adenosine(37)-N6)-threonylcarbamoyltransferase complex dimerization subunit type 1 TsaB [Vicinamibacterales bacterium]
MLVLALETVTRAGSVAVMDGAVCHAFTGDPSRTHGERLPQDVTACLARYGRSVSQVDLFAVIAGPGSFTGLRVGMAAIQGFALSLDRHVVAVPTLEALARGWLADARLAGPTRVVACLDGQRGEVFSAGWELDRDAVFEGARVSFEPRVGTPEELGAELRRLADRAPTVVVGDGGRRYAAALEAPSLAIQVADLAVPLAEVAARTAMAHPERAVAPHALRPIYIRRPDAVLARDRALARSAADAADPLAGFTIDRAATREDVAAVEALQGRTFSNPWAAESIRWELEHTDVARLYVMRAPDRRVVAYCACWIIFDELHINSLAVDDAWRRRGVARRLLETVLREATSEGARSATLEVRRSNEAARALYEGLGFHVDAVRRDYYQHPREDALILWNRRLAPRL